jgi:RNA polymerase sigma-70 factor, ECF subfamily
MPDELKWMIARELPRLRRYAHALRYQPAAADDLVQDCLERALRKRHLWTRRGSLRNWLLRMLYRTHLNALRGRRPQASLDDLTDAEPALAQPASQTQRVELREMEEALGRLPAEQRDTLLLVVLEGLTYDEAAFVLQVPVGTVRSRLSRARSTLVRLREGAAVEGAPPEHEPKDGGGGRPRLRRIK